MPFCAPDFSNSDEYSSALAGVSGGTRIGPPLICGCMLPGGGGEKLDDAAGAGGAVGMLRPSNLGMGAAGQVSVRLHRPIKQYLTPKGQLWRWIIPSLIVPNQAQDLAEA